MSLASIYSARGKHELAEPLLQQVLEWRESWVKFTWASLFTSVVNGMGSP